MRVKGVHQTDGWETNTWQLGRSLPLLPVTKHRAPANTGRLTALPSSKAERAPVVDATGLTNESESTGWPFCVAWLGSQGQW